MKKLFFFARCFAIIAMISLFVQNDLLGQVPCGGCIRRITTFSSGELYAGDWYLDVNNQECIVLVYFNINHYVCPEVPSDYFEFAITKIEQIGTCTGLTQQDIIKRANRIVIDHANKLDYTYGYPTYIKTPQCIKETFTGSKIWVACVENECCRVYFDAHWIPSGGVLDSIGPFTPSNLEFCLEGPEYPAGCTYNCASNKFPEVGYLDHWYHIPPVCFGCNPSNYTDNVVTLEFPNQPGFPGNATFSAEYFASTTTTSTCFGIYSFNAIDNHTGKTPTQILKLLIEKALTQVKATGSNLATLNISKCWRQPSPSVEYYIPCNGEGCCTIEFQYLTGSPKKAKVISNTNSAVLCISPCDAAEICSEYPENSEHEIPNYKIGILDQFERIENTMIINPNPTTGVFSLDFNTTEAGKHLIKVVDIQGFEIYRLDINAIQGGNTLNLDLTKIPIGVYYLQLLNNDKMISNVKFIKN